MPSVDGSPEMQDRGRKALTAFYAALRALKFYPVENVTVQQALDELQRQLSALLEVEGTVEVRVVGEFFFLNPAHGRQGTLAGRPRIDDAMPANVHVGPGPEQPHWPG